jgi:hypothetical protein
MKKNSLKPRVVWEPVETHDAEARIAEAFDMLFAEMRKEEVQEEEKKKTRKHRLPLRFQK